MFSASLAGALGRDTGEVILKIAKAEASGQQDAQLVISSWTAYLDDDNRRLAFYPAPPESVAMIKKSKERGGLSGGISLYKK